MRRFETGLRRALLGTALVLPCLFGFLTTYLLLVIAVLALGDLLLRLRRERRIEIDPASKLFLLGWLLLALVIAIDGLAAGRPHDLLYAFDFGMLLLYAPMAALLGRGTGPLGAVILADLALFGVIVAAIVAVAEEAIYRPERVGFIGNDPIRFGDTALILGFLALLGVSLHQGWRRWLYLLGPALAVVVALLAGARSALIAFPVLAVLAILLLVRRRLAAAVIAGGTVVVFAGLIVVAAIGRDARVNSLFEIARSMLGGGAVADEGTRERFALYRAGAKVFFEQPWLGVGWRQRMPAVTAALPDADKALGGLPHLHNEVLNFSVGAGLVGIFVYLLLLAAPLVALARSPRDSQFRSRLYAVAILLAAYTLLGLADVMLGFETHTALFVAWSAVFLGYCRDERSSPLPLVGEGGSAQPSRVRA